MSDGAVDGLTKVMIARPLVHGSLLVTNSYKNGTSLTYSSQGQFLTDKTLINQVEKIGIGTTSTYLLRDKGWQYSIVKLFSCDAFHNEEHCSVEQSENPVLLETSKKVSCSFSVDGGGVLESASGESLTDFKVIKKLDLKCIASGALHEISSVEVASTDLKGQIVSIVETKDKDGVSKENRFSYYVSRGSIEDTRIAVENYKPTKQINFSTELLRNPEGKYELVTLFLCDPSTSPTECPDQPKEIIRERESVNCNLTSINYY